MSRKLVVKFIDETTNMTNEFIKDGSFNRQTNRFTAPFGNQPSELLKEKGRYRLLWPEVFLWARRSVIVRKLLGLEDVIYIKQ